MMNQKMAMAEKVEQTLMGIERRYTSSPFVSAVGAAYVLYIAHEVPELTKLDEILAANKVPASLARRIVHLIGEHWEKYLPLLTAFSRADLKDYFSAVVDGGHLDGRRLGFYSSSQPIIELAVRLLGLKAGDSVCDLGCAVGDFLRRAYEVVSAGSAEPLCAGLEIDESIAMVAAIRMKIEGLNVSIRGESIFQQKHVRTKFAKVFCDAPHPARGLVQDPEVADFVRNAFVDFPELNLNMTGDWLFAARAVAAMKKGGRAAVVMSPSSMFDGRNAPYRRYFVQRGFVEAVIALPPRLFAHTNIANYLVIFSEGNESVRMVRAGELCYQNRRYNVIGTAHIGVIAACLGLSATCDREGLDDYRVSVEKDALLEGDCNLTVGRHFVEVMSDEDTVAFKVLIAASKRGCTIPSMELDRLVDDDETPYRYLAPSDVNEGVLAAELPRLRELPKGAEAFVAKRGDLVITRVMASGAAIRTAVVDMPEDKVVLPNGNLLVITVDEERTDPYFIKTWLDSDFAQRYLSICTAGGEMRTLGMRVLEELPVPVMPLARQKEIGAACREAVRRYERLRDEFAAAKAALPHIFENCVSAN